MPDPSATQPGKGSWARIELSSTFLASVAALFSTYELAADAVGAVECEVAQSGELGFRRVRVPVDLNTG
jgi:hypothetical protein